VNRVTTADIEIHGRRIDVVDVSGDTESPAIVLLHEGLGSIDLWRSFPEDLRRATGRRLVAFSRHGHGRSEPPAEPRTPAFFHDEALRVLPELREQLDLTDPVLVGHSDGASIALIHAAHHPVSATVLLAPHVFVEPITVAAIRHAREDYMSGPLRDRMARYHDDVDAASGAGATSGWTPHSSSGTSRQRPLASRHRRSSSSEPTIPTERSSSSTVSRRA
jgi:pimeloyl-ACP methyl ester carboxylesterase